MITEDRVWAILVESNPLPEESERETLDVDATSYLATLEQRSSEVTQLDTRRPDSEESGLPIAKILLAVAAVALVGVGILFATRNSGPPVVTASPSSTTIAQATTTLPEALGTVETVEAMIAAYNERNLDALMEFFAEDAVVEAASVRTEIHQGAAQIRIAFSVLTDFLEGDEAVTISNVSVDGDTVTWDQIERRTPLEDRCHDGVTAVVIDGKIQRWVWPQETVACP